MAVNEEASAPSNNDGADLLGYRGGGHDNGVSRETMESFFLAGLDPAASTRESSDGEVAGRENQDHLTVDQDDDNEEIAIEAMTISTSPLRRSERLAMLPPVNYKETPFRRPRRARIRTSSVPKLRRSARLSSKNKSSRSKEERTMIMVSRTQYEFVGDIV